MQEEEADPASAASTSSNHYGPARASHHYTRGLFESDCDPASTSGSLHYNSKAAAAETQE